MRILLASSFRPYDTDSPRLRLIDALTRKLTTRGHEVGRLLMPFTEESFAQTRRAMDIWQWEPTVLDGQAADLVIAFDFPSHGLQHPRKVTWLTSRPKIYGNPEADSAWRGAVVGHENQQLLASYSRFAISLQVQAQLKKINGLDSELLAPAPENPEDYVVGNERGYILAPDCSVLGFQLLLGALRTQGHEVSIVILGPPSFAAWAVQVGVGSQVRVLTDVTAGDRALLFSHARAIFIETNDDPAFTTVEARLSSKAIIRPIEEEEIEGGVVAGGTTSASLADALRRVDTDPDWARRVGFEGRLMLDDDKVSWDYALNILLA